jgi:hypothetical protein
MLTAAKIALAAALILGTALAALAKGGGGVTSCSLDGVNTERHHKIFHHPDAAREYGFIQSADGVWHVRPDCHR